MSIFSPSPLWVFIHIPKCGGVSTTSALEEIVGKRRVHSLAPPDWNGEYVRAIGRVDRRFSPIRLVAGHMRYGIHREIARPVKYMTFLRDPAERVISLYRFILTSPLHPLHEIVQELGSFDRFCSASVTAESDNGMVRILSGDPALDWYGATETVCTPFHLETAKRNLAAFEVVGFTHRIGEGLRQFCRATDRRWSGKAPVKNRTRPHPSNEVTRLDLGAIAEQRNGLDRDLFEFAVGNFGTSAS